MQLSINTINGVTIRNNAGQITLEIPQGMTGKALRAWKRRNESAIIPLGVKPAPSNPEMLDLDESDSEGDTGARQ